MHWLLVHSARFGILDEEVISKKIQASSGTAVHVVSGHPSTEPKKVRSDVLLVTSTVESSLFPGRGMLYVSFCVVIITWCVSPVLHTSVSGSIHICAFCCMLTQPCSAAVFWP